MKIVHVCGGKNIHGMQRHVLTLAVAQKARGASVLIVNDQPGEFSAACDEYGIPVVIEEGLELPPSEPQAKGVTEKLSSTFTSFGAEVIHCHTRRATMKVIPVGNKLGVPCVYTHHVAPTQGFDAAKNLNLKFATISVSRADWENLKKIGISESELYYVPNGTKIMPRDGRRSDRANLMFVGRLEYVKGVDIAILVMAEMKRRHGPECPILDVYGDGTLEEYAKEMVSVLRLDDVVRFHGVQAGILEHCASTDILIVPSRSEVGPLVVLEAMSRGMHIVTSRVGEVAEMLPDQRYGRIVPVNSIAAFADAVDSLLSDIHAGKLDPDLLIERHRAVYSDEKMIESIEAVYERLVQA
ncbi:MAG TPA: glycosyltransferase family 4 protein [Streptosporangiaceae bacterium]|nr:glycosyltransferase family 4 protein [Streptosporangiaceae bacterium]